MNQAWNPAGGNLYQPVSTTFTLPPCDGIDFSRLYLDVWGGTPDYTATVNVSVNGRPLPTINVGGTDDSNPTYNAAATCAYGSGYGIWQLAIGGVSSLLNTNGSANTVTWTVDDPNGQFDGRTYCASLVTVYTSNSLNQTLDYDLAEADGAMQKNGYSGQPSSRTLTISGVNTSNVTGATYYAGYTLGSKISSNTLSFNGTLLGPNPNAVAQSPATGYGGCLVSSNVAAILSGTNTVQYSLTMPNGPTSYYLRANIGLLAVTHPLQISGTQSTSIWASAISGSWSRSENWIGGVPDAVDAAAVINASTTASLTVTLDSPETVGVLILGNSPSTNVGYTLKGSGSNTLTFNNAPNDALITVTNGSHVIEAPVVLADDLVVSGSGTLDFDGASTITGGFSLTMNGAGGTLILSGTDTFTGGVVVNAGTLILASATALRDGSSLTVGAGGTMIFDSSHGAAGPTILSTPSPIAQAVPGAGNPSPADDRDGRRTCCLAEAESVERRQSPRMTAICPVNDQPNRGPARGHIQARWSLDHGGGGLSPVSPW